MPPSSSPAVAQQSVDGVVADQPCPADYYELLAADIHSMPLLLPGISSTDRQADQRPASNVRFQRESSVLQSKELSPSNIRCLKEVRAGARSLLTPRIVSGQSEERL